jgi:hypothetical protein
MGAALLTRREVVMLLYGRKGLPGSRGVVHGFSVLSNVRRRKTTPHRSLPCYTSLICVADSAAARNSGGR